MFATVNGVRDTFNVSALYYNGLIDIKASSKRDTVQMYLFQIAQGDYMWRQSQVQSSPSLNDTSIFIVNHFAIPYAGGLNISLSDQSKSEICGTFSFIGINPTKTDTIIVKDGEFTVYYTFENI